MYVGDCLSICLPACLSDCPSDTETEWHREKTESETRTLARQPAGQAGQSILQILDVCDYFVVCFCSVCHIETTPQKQKNKYQKRFKKNVRIQVTISCFPCVFCFCGFPYTFAIVLDAIADFLGFFQTRQNNYE